MRDRFQFSLVIVVLVLCTATLLYGWIYLSALNAKFSSAVLSPEDVKKMQISQLSEENDFLQNKVQDLEVGLQSLTNELNMLKNTTPTTAPGQTSADGLTTPPSEKTISIQLDPKCFENEEDLNECVVLYTAELAPNITLTVRPTNPITKEMTDLVFEFSEGKKIYTDLTLSMHTITDTTKELARVTFLTQYDIAVNAQVGISETQTTYAYDGEGWISYGTVGSTR